MVSVFGRDREGIVFHVTSLLANHGLNITDLNSRISGEKQKAVYMLVLEVDISPKTSIDHLQKSFSKLAQKLKVRIVLNPLKTATL